MSNITESGVNVWFSRAKREGKRMPERRGDTAEVAGADGFMSKRLRFTPLADVDLESFHALVVDEHVRRYLMDGEVRLREWSEGRVRDSRALFEERGIGLWMVREIAGDALVGFCGFVVFPSPTPEPQLLYALYERFTGRGYATEMASACVVRARDVAGFEDVYAGVDEPNVASRRVLEKLGFEEIATLPGHFGKSFLFRLTGPPRV
jgi:ribosomal-protein-alanine N-acetyltransferase